MCSFGYIYWVDKFGWPKGSHVLAGQWQSINRDEISASFFFFPRSFHSQRWGKRALNFILDVTFCLVMTSPGYAVHYP